jgi:hypothetical protein
VDRAVVRGGRERTSARWNRWRGDHAQSAPEIRDPTCRIARSDPFQATSPTARRPRRQRVAATTLSQEGRYAEAADQARDLAAAHPEYPALLYNLACCESLAGRKADAIEADPSLGLEETLW